VVRPTITVALALEAMDEAGQQQLRALVHDQSQPAAVRIQRVRQMYLQAGVFEKASRLVDKHQQRPKQWPNNRARRLRRLFRYLIDTVLERPDDTAAEPEPAESGTMGERV